MALTTTGREEAGVPPQRRPFVQEMDSPMWIRPRYVKWLVDVAERGDLEDEDEGNEE